MIVLQKLELSLKDLVNVSHGPLQEVPILCETASGYSDSLHTGSLIFALTIPHHKDQNADPEL